VIPVLTALQFGRGFIKSILLAEIFSISSVVLGIIASYYLDLPTGGVIVLLNLTFFSGAYLITK
jgi:zinc transport system permease protein